MRQREIPRTGLALSEIGFGCGGNAGLMVRGTATEQTAIVARALEHGITYFDNAPDYGDGAAETNLGRALQALGARPLLNSKVEIRAENLGDVTAHVIASAEASLRRLRVEHIDVFQIHNGPVSGKTVLTGRGYRTLGLDDYAAAIEGLARLREAGKIGQAGFICRGRDIAEVRPLLESGFFALINVPYTLLNPTAGHVPPPGLTVERDFGQVIDVAQEAGVGVAVHSALAGGYLTDADVFGAARHPLARSVDPAAEAALLSRRKAASLLFLARETGATLAQAAFRFVLSHDGVTTALGGFSSLSQLEEIALVAGQDPFPPDLMARLTDLWQSDFGLAARTVPNR